MPYSALLTQTATLEKATITRDPLTGDEEEVWAVQASGVRCYARFLRNATDIPIGLAEAATHLIHFEFRTDIKTGRWRAIIEGREYRLVDVKDPGNRQHHVEVLARRLN